jgi:hydroxypyruvate reductase
LTANSRLLLGQLYQAAVAAAEPGRALETALRRMTEPPAERLWLLALGKAAQPMAEAAVRHLASRGLAPSGGLIVAPTVAPVPHPALTAVAGDHPEPGPGSLAAAEAVGALSARVGPADEVWVLLSGGTTSLIGAPEPGIDPADLKQLYRLLLGSGLDIAAMNQVRKRFARWGGGKLARALAPARVRLFIVSDVIGDDLAAIGSGPCVPDPTTAGEVRALLARARLWTAIPDAMRQRLEQTERGEIPETPKPGDTVFEPITTELVASNLLALEAVARKATELGLVPQLHREPLSGEAADAGARIAATLLSPRSGATAATGARCLIWGGETTVTLGEEPGLGGRSQELALAAARVLEGSPAPVALLAGGTDGRDGPTDAAGAIVDGATWQAIRVTGRDPASHLARHDAYPALEAAGVLLKPGLTGTNVMDVVIGIC